MSASEYHLVQKYSYLLCSLKIKCKTFWNWQILTIFSVNYRFGLIVTTKRPHRSHCKKFLQKLLQWCFIQYYKQSTWSHTLILTMKAKGQEWMLAWWTQQFSLFASFQLAGHSCSSQNSLAAVALLAKEQRKRHNFIFITYSSKL